MTLLQNDGSATVIQLSEKTHRIWHQLLILYPATIDTNNAIASENDDAAKMTERNQMLREALAEHEKTTRAAICRDLKEIFDTDKKKPVTIKLPAGALHWLLPIFNNIRMGLWQQLGNPKLDEPTPSKPPFPINRVNIIRWENMNLAGLVEGQILDWLGIPSTPSGW